MSDAVIYERDIISERAVSVICNLNELRYRINVFDDPKHPLSVLLTTLFELKEVELDYGNTMDEVEQIEAKYEFASELINIVKDAYNIKGGADTVVPVDIYVPGCAARPQSIIDGIIQARDLFQKRSDEHDAMVKAGKTYEDIKREREEEEAEKVAEAKAEEENREETPSNVRSN